MTSGQRLPIAVVVPTIGRLGPLTRCLASLAACEPRPLEILVVDQSGCPEIAALVAGHDGARLVPCVGRGVALGRNVGLRATAATHVCITDDDCTVPPDWVVVASRQAALHE